MTAAEALSYVRSKWSEFLELYPRLLDLQHEAATTAAEARARGDISTYETSRAQVERLAELVRFHDRLVSEFDRMRGAIPELSGAGLGAIPLVWAGALVALAGGVGYVLARFGAESQIARAAARGDITPAEAVAILEASGPTPFGEAAAALRWIVLGFGALWAWNLLKGARG